MFDSLRVHFVMMCLSGGYFVLEPQSWQSYRKKRRVKNDFKATLSTIVFKPHQFDEFLQQHLGFQLIEIIEFDKNQLKSDERNSDFYNRPLFIYRKPIS